MGSRVLARVVAYALLWLVLAGFHAEDLPAAALAVAAATWASFCLLPPSGRPVSLVAWVQLAARFPGQTVVAGVDVALRALSPRLRLQPGYIAFASRLPRGTAQDGFCAYASLMPGTLPVEIGADGTVRVHCLDTAQPAAAQLAVEEALFARATGHG